MQSYALSSCSNNLKLKATQIIDAEPTNLIVPDPLSIEDMFSPIEVLICRQRSVQGLVLSLSEKTEEETSVKHLERQRGMKVEENKQVVRYDDRHNPRSNNDNRQRWAARGHDFQRNIYQGNSYNPRYQGNNYNPRYQNYNANYYNVRANYPGSYNNSSRFDNRASYNKNDYNNNRFNNDYNYRYNRHYNDSRCIQRYNDNHYDSYSYESF
ncbi:probable cyclin-dependent serine/threonine-protein kinase DDB_G0292550 [Gordionus sp. m RMFG-2023]|uniref:probable cyclin-dependent serine/threonine-protein kinase DDB_G0292550 n=1 Tax=Gordionus sp. m RMFG-2023 TaxID=3053472 RepID=UPI0031FC6A43